MNLIVKREFIGNQAVILDVDVARGLAIPVTDIRQALQDCALRVTQPLVVPIGPDHQRILAEQRKTASASSETEFNPKVGLTTEGLSILMTVYKSDCNVKVLSEMIHCLNDDTKRFYSIH